MRAAPRQVEPGLLRTQMQRHGDQRRKLRGEDWRGGLGAGGGLGGGGGHGLLAGGGVGLLAGGLDKGAQRLVLHALVTQEALPRRVRGAPRRAAEQEPFERVPLLLGVRR